jgi:hypothetical protein
MTSPLRPMSCNTGASDEDLVSRVLSQPEMIIDVSKLKLR